MKLPGMGLREEASCQDQVAGSREARLSPQKVKLLRTNARLRSTSLSATVAGCKEWGRGKDRGEAHSVCLAGLRSWA